MLKPMIQIYPVLPAKDEAERERLRPIGRNRQIYQDVVTGWTDIIKAADRMGVWGAATIEHHFWSEGYEVGPAPGIMNAYWAGITENIRVGQLGYVMSTQNPIRVAEETAIIDHLTQGRSFVGFARGYQSRWTNVVGQHLGARATKSPSAAIYNPSTEGAGFSTATTKDRDLSDDARNRAIFEENVEIVLKAWTEESFSHKGMNWEIPYPYETGVDDWPLAKVGVTQKFGAPGEVDEHGNLRKVSVTPAPYTNPRPPVFVSGSGSPETIEYCARHGFIPTYFTSIKSAGPLSQLYREASAKSGRDWRPGQNQCLVRWIEIGKTKEDALRKVREYDFDIWKNFYASMGRRKLKDGDIFGSLVDSGLFAIGTVDEVRKQLLEEWKIFPAEHIAIVYHYAQMPKDEVIEAMDTFMRHIKPALDEVIDQSGRKAA
jgi:alkanesulfonate monooxygenase SsuD/methylene tetrahydromethanopterin reductase-like flavin-dependent oxidoreductase (luciferase family)